MSAERVSHSAPSSTWCSSTTARPTGPPNTTLGFDGPAHRHDLGKELALSSDGSALYQSGSDRSVYDANDAVLIAYPA